jgi:hypothetical protein
MELMYVFIALGMILFILGIKSKNKINIEFNLETKINNGHKDHATNNIKVISIGMILLGAIIISYAMINYMTNEIINNQENGYQNTKSYQGEMENVDEINQDENINEFYAKARQKALEEENKKILEEQKNDGDLVNGYLKHEGKTKILKIGNINSVINIDESGILKWHAEEITAGCNGDEWCEKNRFYQLVRNFSYYTTTGTDFEYNRKPIEVLNSETGDCDEKSFLLASLLLEKKYKAMIIFTKGHAFVCMNVNNTRNIYPHHAKLKINGLNYYYAETTNPQGYIGGFNKLRPSDFIGVYDINKKRLVDKREIEFYEG